MLEVKNLSKTYKIWDSPKDRLKASFIEIASSLWPSPKLNICSKKYGTDFHALQNVSFSITDGETVGIVGRNGSGKSTLLQIIAGVLRPSKGEIKKQGRIAALLELGVGFNPEFTGIENAHLKASVIGLSPKEIKAKMPEVEAFADIGKFIHQPTRTYSSGMMVRLAFAIEAMVEPDLLIVDEALAVGDEAFQRKCIQKIYDLKKQGTTVLFVSHAASQILELCDRALLFHQGELLSDSSPKAIIDQYQKLIYSNDISTSKKETTKKNRIQPGASSNDKEGYWDPKLKSETELTYDSQGVHIQNVHITSLSGAKINTLIHGKEYIYQYEVEFDEDRSQIQFGFMFKLASGIEIAGGTCSREQQNGKTVAAGQLTFVRFRFRCLFSPGVYFCNAGVQGLYQNEKTFLARMIDCYTFRVLDDTCSRHTGIINCLEDVELGISSKNNHV